MKTILNKLIFVSMLSVVSGMSLSAQDITFSTDSLATYTGAVSVVSGESLYKVPAANLTNTLSGTMSGLTVNQGNGTPGYDGAGLLIRGIGTYGMSGAYNTAKIYVDGFETDMDYISRLSPSEIKSISILKDATSLTLFGMNGAEGVLWIETKRGERGKLHTDFQVRSGVQSAINRPEALSSYEYASLYNQAYSNDAGKAKWDWIWQPYYDDAALETFRTGEGPDINWFDEVMSGTGMYSDTDLSIHGGSDYVNYMVVLGYGNQQGLLNVSNTDATSNSGYERYSIRANLDIRLSKYITASVDMGGRIEDRTRPNYQLSALMDNVAAYPSLIYPVYDESVEGESANYSGTTIYPDNPVASINGLGWVKNHNRIIQSNFRFKEDLDFLLKGLYLQQGVSFYVNSMGSMSKTRNYARYFNGIAQTVDQNTTMTASSFGADEMVQWTQGYVTAGYKNGWGAHRIATDHTLRLSDYKGEGQFQYQNHYVNLSGKFNWSYDDRYILSLGYSYFGSDAFAGDSRWHFYPAISGAWVISNESFLKGNSVVDLLKLRISAGRSGYAESTVTDGLGTFSSNGRYLYQQYYTSSSAGSFYQGNSAPFGSQSTLAPLFIANPDVGPESSMKYNVGLDMSLLGLTFTADAFLDKRSNILTMDNTVMNYYGYPKQFVNVGLMTNMGAEATLMYNGRNGDFEWSAFGTLSYAKNIIDYMAETPQAFDYNAQTGRPYGTRIGLECIGFYDFDDFDADGNLKEGLPVPMFGSVQPGDLKYRDLDGDTVIDQTDVTEIGAPWYPNMNFSLGGAIRYKGLDVTVFFSGACGGTINLLDYPIYTRAFVNNGNAYPIAQNAWAYYPEIAIDTRESADYPRLTTKDNANNYRTSSFWIRSNSFLRLKTAEIGYDFKELLPSSSVFSRMRIYLNAMNPFTLSSVLTEYEMDPESRYGYPALKSYNFGVQLSF